MLHLIVQINYCARLWYKGTLLLVTILPESQYSFPYKFLLTIHVCFTLFTTFHITPCCITTRHIQLITKIMEATAYQHRKNKGYLPDEDKLKRKFSVNWSKPSSRLWLGQEEVEEMVVDASSTQPQKPHLKTFDPT